MSWINFVLIIFYIDFSRCITIVAYILEKSIENFKILCLIYFLKINIKGCNVDIFKMYESWTSYEVAGETEAVNQRESGKAQELLRLNSDASMAWTTAS